MANDEVPVSRMKRKPPGGCATKARYGASMGTRGIGCVFSSGVRGGYWVRNRLLYVYIALSPDLSAGSR